MTMGTMHGGEILYVGTKLKYMYTYTAYITYIHLNEPSGGESKSSTLEVLNLVLE